RLNPFLSRSGNRSVPHRLLARKLAGPANRLALLPRRPFRRLLVESPPLHFPEHAFALHFPLQSAESLVDIVIAYEDLQDILLHGYRCVLAGQRGFEGTAKLMDTAGRPSGPHPSGPDQC